jgi:GWxTD domain-containing protein
MLLMFGSFCLTLLLGMPEGAHGAQTRVSAFPAWNVPAGAGAPAASGAGLATVAPWLVPFWMAGVCISYLVYLASWISVSRMRRRGVCCVSEYWLQQLSRLGAQMRVKRPVQMLESCLVNVPVVLGHFRPVILMPAGLLTGLPAGQIEAVLLHELAHIRRYDYLVNVLQRSLEGLLFYHPAVWWISRVIRAERENCCDDAAVGVSGSAHEYAVALAAMEQSRWPGREPAVAATGGSLVKRIARLLNPKVSNRPWTPVFAAVVLMTTAAVMLAAWQAAPPPQSAVAAQNGDKAEPSPYAKWLNEDVIYIATDQERAAFRRLKTDEEREKFIEQFWLRRDPVTGTPENEFKQEHYRRIAYANQRFGTTSGRPGWRTDRGHMYIVYGPPDEIESHPGGTQRPYGTEVWLYRHVESLGDNLTVTFIDRTGTGDYQTAPGNGR